ncbi:MAG: hypothetical protein LBG15_06550 [Dysgonamonadaceae bacterium]|jgi:hypothetical protein|nr:hypothetical protein [Dysgonamonadaceae bacterium]
METKKNKKNLMTNLFRGDILEEIVVKQFYLMALIVSLIFIFISNDYYCKKKLTEIEDLKDSLKDVKYENLIILTELTSISRQSQVKELLKKNNIELTGPTTPAFEIKK